MKSHRLSSLVASLVFLSVLAGTALGQGSGTIQGTVTDPTGAVIPQAAITARNIATGVETARQTTCCRTVRRRARFRRENTRLRSLPSAFRP